MPIGSVIGGALGLLSNMFTSYHNEQMVNDTNFNNRQAVERQNQFNLEQWQRENAYNNPINQLQRLRAAGLNPGIMYGSGGVSNSATPSPAMQSSRDVPPQSTFQIDPLTAAQIANLDAQTRKVDAETEETNENTIGKSIENRVNAMNSHAFESAYNDGLVHAAVKAGFGKQIDDARMSRYTLFESAWNFAILTGISVSDSLTSSDYMMVDHRDENNKSIPFDFTEASFKRAQSLFIGGQEAQTEANSAAKLIAQLQRQRNNKDLNIWSKLNEWSNSDNPWIRVPSTIGLIGLWIAEQRFSMPSFNFKIEKGDKTFILPKKDE